MIFNIVDLIKEVDRRVQIYNLQVLEKISANNPGWIDKLKEDVELLDPNISKERVEAKVNEVLQNPDFVAYETDWELIKKLFIFDEKFLEQFKIE